MKFKRILAMPFTLVADIATLGNMGGPSFTEQLFAAERREQSMEYEKEMVRLALRLAEAQIGQSGKTSTTKGE